MPACSVCGVVLCGYSDMAKAVAAESELLQYQRTQVLQKHSQRVTGPGQTKQMRCKYCNSKYSGCIGRCRVYGSFSKTTRRVYLELLSPAQDLHTQMQMTPSNCHHKDSHDTVVTTYSVVIIFMDRLSITVAVEQSQQVPVSLNTHRLGLVLPRQADIRIRGL